jgi:acetyl esterase/lipase
VSYAADTLTGHRMDIYLPEHGEAPYPVVVVVAGSAWFGNDTKERAYRVMGVPLLDAGYAVVAINHRSSREAIFPAQINDVKAAVRFVRANASTYGLDPPFLILHGDADPLVPHCQSELLYEALQDNGVESTLVIVPGGGHGDGMWVDPYVGQMVRFFDAQKAYKTEER